MPAGRPKTGQPSRSPEARSWRNKSYNIKRLNNNSSRVAFDLWLDTLVPNIPKPRKTFLFNNRATVTKRYTTARIEVELLLDHFKQLPETCLDVPSGNKVIESVMLERDPKINVTNMDIDPKTQPDHRCDYTNPAEYRHVDRPDFVFGRYEAYAHPTPS